MATPSIAHFGTTLIEEAPPEGVAQEDVPMTGALERTDRFLQLFGMKLAMRNLYEGLGRQYIYRRGSMDDVDYVEKDTFTSYRGALRPDAGMPRVGDTIFRLSHADPIGIYRTLKEEDLIECLGTPEQEDAFLNGAGDHLLFMGPDAQRYELCPTRATTADNHVVYIWTDPAELDETVADFSQEFGFEAAGDGDFHGISKVRLIRRDSPGMTLGFLTPFSADQIAPRWTDDIFLEGGYSHYRLGSPDMVHTQKVSRESFPQGGDVAFIYFRESYLELVQIQPEEARAENAA